MAGSAKKPYLRLKKSLVDFFRAPVVFIKQINQKFSEFEKPYLDSEYQQMHLDWPSWTWGGPWSGPKFPPSGPFGSVPKIYTVGCVVHCWHYDDCEDWVECSVLHWGGNLGKRGSFEVTGDVIDVQEVWGGLVDLRIKVDPNVSTPVVTVKYTDPTDQTCFDDISITCASCDPAAIISYTTLQMWVTEQQTLSASLEGEAYTWAIASGGGSLSSNVGNSVVYTAPATNANCAGNPTITLSCEGGLLDSVTIAITAVGGYAGYTCCDRTGVVPIRAHGHTRCQGDHYPGVPDVYCQAPTHEPCASYYPANGYCEAWTYTVCADIGETDGGWYDLRDADQIAAGCCPEQAL